jgi:hypothetical protein
VGEQPARPGWYDVTLREGWNTVRLLWNNGSWWAHDHAGETLHRIDSRIYDTLQWRGCWRVPRRRSLGVSRHHRMVREHLNPQLTGRAGEAGEGPR